MTNFTGSDANDIFTGSEFNDKADGNGGNDHLSGNGNSDDLSGGAGMDWLYGGEGSDVLYGGERTDTYSRPYYGQVYTPPTLDTAAEADTLDGGDGNDKIFAGYNDTVDGGSGTDELLISFLGADIGVTIDFNNGVNSNGAGTISSIEKIAWVQGSDFADTITMGSDNSNFAPLFGMGGNDTLIGGYYTGQIDGGDGNDTIDATRSIYGFPLYGGDGDDVIRDHSNGASIYGGNGADTLYGHEAIDGGAGNDTIYALRSYYSRAVHGGTGADKIWADENQGHPGLYGDEGNDRIEGGAGSDMLVGGSGGDNLFGGGGSDKLFAAGPDGDPLTTTRGEATWDSGTEVDRLYGGAGNDTLSIGIGDTADGGDGVDALVVSFAGAGAGVVVDTTAMGSGTWTVAGTTVTSMEILQTAVGSSFDDSFFIATSSYGATIYGGDGNDSLTSNASTVVFYGGDGNDKFRSGIAGDFFNGGAGTDMVSYRDYASGVTVDLVSQKGAGGDSFVSVEDVVGSGFADTITGNSSVNALYGFDGDDIIDGKGGADRMVGGRGDDIYYVDDTADDVRESASEGYDIVYSTATYALPTNVEALYLYGDRDIDAFGTAGDDVIEGNSGANVIDGGAGNDLVDGGAGSDTASYASATAGVKVSLALEGKAQDTLGAGTDTLRQIENLAGSDYADKLIGNGLANVLSGGDADDFLDGRAGDDTLLGGNGHDFMRGQFGNDRLEGGAGDDILRGDFGDDTMAGGTGDDLYFVESVNDVVIENSGEGSDEVRLYGTDWTVAAGIETVRVLYGSGTVTGNDEAQTIFGSSNVNTLLGMGGNDYIDGGNQADILDGGSGDDILIGGRGQDTISGGTGADRFVFKDVLESSASSGYSDIITDFSQADGDLIALSQIDAIAGGSDDAFTFVGNAAFSGTAGELRYKFEGGDTIVQMDVDGDGVSDMSIRLTGEIELLGSDFLL